LKSLYESDIVDYEYEINVFSRNNNFLSLSIETESGNQSSDTGLASSIYGTSDYDLFNKPNDKSVYCIAPTVIYGCF
jgi:hypothetical protein